MEVHTKVSHYTLKLHQIQDCEESEESEERTRSVLKHTNARYHALRTMTENQKIPLLTQLLVMVAN